MDTELYQVSVVELEGKAHYWRHTIQTIWRRSDPCHNHWRECWRYVFVLIVWNFSVIITNLIFQGGSVMLQTMAYGGSQGDFLFQNSIAASPYLPMQYDYNAWAPTQAYFAFATAVGCFNGSSISTNSTSIFQCLVGKDTYILQQASAIVSASGLSGVWHTSNKVE